MERLDEAKKFRFMAEVAECLVQHSDVDFYGLMKAPSFSIYKLLLNKLTDTDNLKVSGIDGGIRIYVSLDGEGFYYFFDRSVYDLWENVLNSSDDKGSAEHFILLHNLFQRIGYSWIVSIVSCRKFSIGETDFIWNGGDFFEISRGYKTYTITFLDYVKYCYHAKLDRNVDEDKGMILTDKQLSIRFEETMDQFLKKVYNDFVDYCNDDNELFHIVMNDDYWDVKYQLSEEYASNYVTFRIEHSSDLYTNLKFYEKTSNGLNCMAEVMSYYVRSDLNILSYHEKFGEKENMHGVIDWFREFKT